MSSTAPRAASLAVAVAGAVAVAAVLVVTTLGAARAYGTTFPSLFVDPFGGFSIVLLPDWDSARLDIPVGAPVHAVSEEHDPSVLPAERLARASATAAERGNRQIALSIGAATDVHVELLSLRTIGIPEVLWFYVLYLLAGLLLLWSGVTVAVVAWHRPGGRAYVGLAIIGFLFLATFLDYQTTRWLAPVFAATTLGNSLTLFALAWWFPEPPRASKLVGRAAAIALGIGVVLSLTLAAAVVLHLDLRPLRQLADAMMPIALITLLVSVGLRLRAAGDADGRAELRSAARGLMIVPLVFGATFLGLSAIGRAPMFHMLLPFASVAIPGAVGHALIRHNALAVRAVVTQRLLVIPVVLVALAVGCACGEYFGSPDRWAEPILVALSVATTTAVMGWLAASRFLSLPTRTFQPTLEELASEVATLRTPDAIRGRLGELVHRCLPARRITTAAPTECATLPLSSAARSRFDAGETVWTETTPDAPLASLAAPLHFGGAPLGAIVVAPQPGDPLFTDAEVRVIQTLVSLGALALHHAELLAELEKRRAIELSANRDERRRAVDAVAAELSHELTYPITFLRHFLKQVAAGRASDAALDVGEDELRRLERMLAWVRRLKITTPAVGPVQVRLVATHVLVLLESELERRGLACEVDVPEDFSVIADHDSLLQLLANLLRNATQAARAKVGVVFCVDAQGEKQLRVWDDGPGVPPEIAERIFDPLFTTQDDAEGHGLGLAVAQRVATGFGWSIALHRDEGRTVFSVHMKRRNADRARAHVARAAS